LKENDRIRDRVRFFYISSMKAQSLLRGGDGAVCIIVNPDSFIYSTGALPGTGRTSPYQIRVGLRHTVNEKVTH
jgi:hypothetical protein